jgi:hypothetical protein
MQSADLPFSHLGVLWVLVQAVGAPVRAVFVL